METKTLDELKLMAANRIPSELEAYDDIIDGTTVKSLRWKRTTVDLRETEWYYIVHLLEEKMDELERISFIKELWRLNPKSKIARIKWNQDALNNEIWWTLVHAEPEQKLTAMHNSGFLKD